MKSGGPIGVAVVAASLLLSAATGPSAQPPAAGLPVANAGATTLADGRVLIAGGLDTAGVTDSFHLISATQILPGQLLSPRSDTRATLLPDGHVLVTGGRDARGALDTLELIDPAHATTALAGLRLSTPVSQHATSLLPDGRVLVTGGRSAHQPLDTLQALDLDARQVAELVGLAEPRAHHTATVLTTGAVLLAGGEGASGPLASAEISDGTTATLLLDRLVEARAGHTATLLPSGDVLIAGGYAAGRLTASLEQFDAEQQTFRALKARLRTARADHVAVLLPRGQVLFWGGVDVAGRVIDGGELYDSQSGTIRPVGTLTSALAAPPSTPTLAYSSPSDGDVEVPSTVKIAVRFTEPIAVTSVSPASVRLTSAAGTVAVRAVPVESGLLLFVAPQAALEAGTKYTLTLAGLRSGKGVALATTTIAFTTAGSATQRGGHGGYYDVTDPDEDPSGLVRDQRTGRLVSPWQDLAPLQAPPGVTALAGQVLQLNGRPLHNVTLEIDGRRTRSDVTGRFLLANLPESGARVLVVDGRTAHRPHAEYGLFEISVEIAAGLTTPLDYAIWMPKIDWANAVTIPSPTTTETVISTPRLPGLELRLPANTVVRDRDGKLVTRISLTPVPSDRPPFPLPDGVSFPLYLTTQPGGARLETGGGHLSAGAPVIYPNYFGFPPGTEADFWRYEPINGVRWFQSGNAHVDEDGSYFEPDELMRVHKFTMFTALASNLTGTAPGGNGPPPPSGPPPGGAPSGGDPVDLATGLFLMTKTDLAIDDVLPISLTRTYRQNDTVSRAFGIGMNHQYSLSLISENGFITISLILPDGGRVRYQRTSAGTGYVGAVLQHTETPTRFYKSLLQYVGAYPGNWTITLLDGTVYTFQFNGGLMSIGDRFGNTISLTREMIVVPSFLFPLPWGKIQRINSPSGRWIDLTYDSQSRVVQAAGPGGRTVGYTYDSSGRLQSVIDAVGGVTQYTYDASHRMLTLIDPRGITYLTNEYEASGRVKKQTQADLTTYQFAYSLNGAGAITQTDLTNPRGYVRRVAFTAAGYSSSDTVALGQAQAQTTVYSRQTGTNFVLTATDALGRQTDVTYDGQGNVASVIKLAGTATAVTTSFTWEPAGTGVNRLTSVSTPIATTTRVYNDTSRTITTTDSLSHATTITYNLNGQVATVANPLGHTISFTYDGQANLTTVEDPLGKQTARSYDIVGRLIRQIDPRGNATLFSYDALNRLTTIVDALNGTTRFTYDANGNLLSVTDARGNATNYTYNTMDRLITRTDALSRQENYGYDTNGNLTSVTDRKSQATTLSYDPLDRLSSRLYQDGAQVIYDYDAGNRLRQVAYPSASDAVTLTVDDLDRVVSEATPNGTVTHTYDAIGRRLTMNVPGQTQIGYGWDTANRVTTITQGGNVVMFDYDNANRRTKLTYPSGTVMEYGYDNASRLTGLTYKRGTSTLGTLAYAYDGAAQRTQAGGTWARTALPSALASATYNAANHQVAFGATTLSYDLNGNLSNDGTNTYSWGARNELMAISGPVASSFVYDALGRRQRKTVNGTVTDFVYNGLNPVREAVGATTVDLMTGVGIDEYIMRVDTAGAREVLSDALGSTVALVDSLGAVQTEYSYEPFGALTLSGSGTTSELSYTGREDDGTGLYYFRARYYHPKLQRFIAEDPIGFAGSDVNLYAYVANKPINLTDPLGLTWTTNARFLFGFLTGTIGTDLHYSLSDVEGMEMANSIGAGKLRQAFMQGGCRTVGQFAYDTWEAAWDTVLNPYTLDWSSTSAQVGGFADASAVRNGNGTVTFTIPNVAGTKSFFYHAVSDRRGSVGPMRNVKQTFQWTETIPNQCGGRGKPPGPPGPGGGGGPSGAPGAPGPR